MAKYKMECYYSSNNEIARELEVQPGLDQTLYYEELETAKMAAFFAIDFDAYDAVVITDMETGDVVVKVGEVPIAA